MPKIGDKRLFVVACESFGSWGKAVEAAGLDYDKIRKTPRNPYQTKQAIVKGLQRRQKKGWSLTASEMRRGKHKDISLLEAALKRFGKWSIAKEAAGKAN